MGIRVSGATETKLHPAILEQAHCHLCPSPSCSELTLKCMPIGPSQGLKKTSLVNVEVQEACHDASLTMAITYTTKEVQVKLLPSWTLFPEMEALSCSAYKVPRTLHPLQSENPSLRSHCYDSLEHINPAAHPFFSVFAQHPTHSILYCNLNLAPNWRSEKTALTTLANSTIRGQETEAQLGRR